jgi:DNA-binding NtrC family response regulator
MVSTWPAPHVPVADNGGDAGGMDEEGLKGVGRRAAREAERVVLLEVLQRLRWNRAETARVLKVSYKTLLGRLVECGIQEGRCPRPQPDPAADGNAALNGRNGYARPA